MTKKNNAMVPRCIRFERDQIKLCDKLNIDINQVCREAVELKISKEITRFGSDYKTLSKILSTGNED